MTRHFPPDFLDLLIELNRADAKYLLVGGHAVAFHGRPRATKDIDLWLEASPENAGRVLCALRAFGAPLGTLSERDLAGPGSGFRMGTPPFRIELLTKVSGVSFDEAWPRRELWDLDGTPLAVIGRVELLRNKRAAGRPQDLADVDVLERQAKTRTPAP
jgi:hypothetical protein